MREWTAEDETALRAQADALHRTLGRPPDAGEVAEASGLPLSQVLAMGMGDGVEPGRLTRSILGDGGCLAALSRAGISLGHGTAAPEAPAGGWHVRALDGLAPHRGPDAATVLFRFVCERGGERLVLDARDHREGLGLVACLSGRIGKPRLRTDRDGWVENPYRDADRWRGAAFPGGVLLDDPFRHHGRPYLDWIGSLPD